MDTYTSPFGTTQQGTQQQNIYNALSAITGMTPSDPMAQGSTELKSQALAMQQAQPAFMQQAQQSLTQQSGIPQLQNQYGDLSKIFDLYLHDNNLAQKYTSPGLSTGQSPIFGADTSGNYNPYLQDSNALVAAANPPSTGAGFGGFTSPTMVTSAMGQPVSAAGNLMNLLQGAIGSEQGIVQNKTGDAAANYQQALNTLLGISNIYENERNRNAAATGPGTSGYNQMMMDQVLSDVKGKMTLKDLINKYRAVIDPNSIYQIYSSNSPYGAPKEDPSVLYQWGITQAKPTAAQAKQAQAAIDTEKSYGTVTSTINNLLDQYNALSGIEKGNPLFGGVSSANPFSMANNYEKQRIGLAAALKDLAGAGAGSGVRVNDYEMRNWANLLPSPSKTPAQVKSDIISLDKQLKGKFGKGLDPVYLQQFGISTNSSTGGAKATSGGDSNDPLGIR